MADERHCAECGGKLPIDAPQGLCPQCLMKLGLPSEAGAERRHASQEQRAVPAGSPGGFVPPAPEELAEKFPQLEILELLGQGGMGAVYKARQRQLDRLVALKILPPEVGQTEAFAERFSREARSLARLNHPGIVSVFDFGRTEDGLYYFVMEFVDGTDLRRVIQAGQLSPAEALAIVPQVCEALQYAHEEGLVHRDIKPENILLDKKGRVKIADFGLAKLLDRPQSSYTLTQAGQRMGTPHYMAPEQIEGAHKVDHRADIYSLGVVFYEMLTGELPIGRFAPPSQKVQVDVRLDEIVLHTLEKEPERRYQHASEVKTDVETIASDSTSRPGHIQRVPTTRRFSRAAIVGACLAPAALFAVTHPGDKAIGYLFGSLEVLGSGISAGGVMLAVLGLVGFATPFATTILGFAAIAHIRNSAGRVYGMGLAVFDGLLFPLLVLDADIFVVLGLLALLARIPSVLPLSAVTCAALLVLPISGVVDFIVARWAWRKANAGLEPPQSQTGHGPSAAQRERFQQSGEIKADVKMILSTERPAAATNAPTEYNPMDKHVTIVAALNVGLSILGLVFAGVVFTAVVGGGRISQDLVAMRVTSIVGPVVSVLIAATCIPGIIGGIGLFARRPWARILVIILGVLDLLEVPFGTILGIYTIWVLVKKETVALFEHAQHSRQNQRGFPGPPTAVQKTAAIPRMTPDIRDSVEPARWHAASVQQTGSARPRESQSDPGHTADSLLQEYQMHTVVKWWTTGTLIADAVMLAFACLFLAVRFKGAGNPGPIGELFVFASYLAREAGVFGLLFLISNAVLIGRHLLNMYGKAWRPTVLDMLFSPWIVLTIVTDIAAMVFPILTLLYSAPAGAPGAPAAGLTVERLLVLAVLLWTVIFVSNTYLLVRSLFHKYNLGEAEGSLHGVRSVVGKTRVMGLLYLGFGGALALFGAAVLLADYEYHVPYACQGLECIHGFETAPDGRMYCAKYPPKDIKYAGISPGVIRGTKTAGNVFAVLGLLCSGVTAVCSLLWLIVVWIPREPLAWYAVACRAAPAIAFVLLILATCLKSAY